MYKVEITPTFTIRVYLSTTGYQVDVDFAGEEIGSECRDFGGSPKIDELVDDFYKRFKDLVEDFRKAH